MEEDCSIEPTPSTEIKDAYMTFLEMKEVTDISHLASGDEYLPSLISNEESKQIRCQICPSWSFTSKTESLRHMKVLHRHHKATLARNAKPSTYKCNYEGCNKCFPSPYYLSLHRKMMGHQKRKSPAISSRTKIADEAKKSKKSIIDIFKVVLAEDGNTSSAEPSASSAESVQSQDDSASESSNDDDAFEMCIAEKYIVNELPDSVAKADWLECKKCQLWYHNVCEKVPDSFDPKRDTFVCSVCK